MLIICEPVLNIGCGVFRLVIQAERRKNKISSPLRVKGQGEGKWKSCFACFTLSLTLPLNGEGTNLVRFPQTILSPDEHCC